MPIASTGTDREAISYKALGYPPPPGTHYEFLLFKTFGQDGAGTHCQKPTQAINLALAAAAVHEFWRVELRCLECLCFCSLTDLLGYLVYLCLFVHQHVCLI